MGIKTITPLFLTLFGCVTPQYRPMPPVEAGIPELAFSYFWSNTWKEAYGHASARFVAGEKKKFKISLFSKGGECTIRTLNGDVDSAQSCTGKKEIEIDLGNYKNSEPEVLSFVVSYEKLGTQVGYFYPNLSKDRPVLNLAFVCPYQQQNGGFSVCTRPATYRFIYRLNFLDSISGKFIHRVQCVGGSLEEKIFDAQGPFDRDFELTSDKPTYCVIGIGEKNTGKSHVIHVRFYDPRYIPLLPAVVKQTNAGLKICATDNYDALKINNTYETYLRIESCTSALFQSPLLVFAGDRFGRFSFLEFSGSYLYNGWNFYYDAKDYAFEQIQRTCGEFPDKQCIEKNYKKLMYTDRVIQAVENWDASILYRG
jgi:hypothetical protein